MQKKALTVFLITGVFAGLLLSWQFQTRIPKGTTFKADEWSARQDILNEYLDEQAYLKSRIVTLREQIHGSQTAVNLQTEGANLEILDTLKKEIGLTPVSGQGVEITLNDSPLALREGAKVSDVLLIQAADLRDIVNLLFAADAEAISVNDQRIIATSPISSVGTTILINNSHIAAPFVIRAVGDTGIISQRLSNRTLLGNLYSRRDKGEIIFEAVAVNSITIPIYNADLKAKYINLITQ